MNEREEGIQTSRNKLFQIITKWKHAMPLFIKCKKVFVEVSLILTSEQFVFIVLFIHLRACKLCFAVCRTLKMLQGLITFNPRLTTLYCFTVYRVDMSLICFIVKTCQYEGTAAVLSNKK